MAVTPLEIKHLQHHEIDGLQWDNCISKSNNPLIYAEFEFLNAISPNWEALIFGNYEYVMPLTWKKKWGIRYLVQPAFVQQAGIFSDGETNADVVEAFLQKAKSIFSFAEFTLQSKNICAHASANKRMNYIIDLNQSYETIQKQYSPSLQQILLSPFVKNLLYRSSAQLEESINLIRKVNGSKLNETTAIDFLRFTQLCKSYQQQGRLIIREALADNEIIAVAVLLKSNNRLYNLLSGVTAAGRKNKANHFLYNNIINEFSNKPMIFDFEGSDLPGVAFFYRSFGPKEEPYDFIRWNNLPWPLKWLKK